MNPYKEKTSEWHAFEQGVIEGTKPYALLLGGNAIYGKMGAGSTDALDAACEQARNREQSRNLHEIMKVRASSTYGKGLMSEPASARGKVLNHLRMHGPTRRKELYKLGNLKAIDKAITVLQAARQIQRVKYGTYAIRQKDSK